MSEGYWIYAVEYSNYEPPETHSLHSTEELAQEEASRMNAEATIRGTDNWDVSKRWVHTS